MCYIIIHIFEGTYNSFEKINTASNKKAKDANADAKGLENGG